MGRAGRSIGPITRAVAAELRAERARADVTIAVLSDSCGVPRSTLSRMLKGEAAMDVAALYAVTASLGVTLHDVMARAAASVEGADEVPEVQAPTVGSRAIPVAPPSSDEMPLDLQVVDGGAL
jgi:transcriptional regulator with XRE-family HTH domain